MDKRYYLVMGDRPYETGLFTIIGQVPNSKMVYAYFEGIVPDGSFRENDLLILNSLEGHNLLYGIPFTPYSVDILIPETGGNWSKGPFRHFWEGGAIYSLKET